MHAIVKHLSFAISKGSQGPQGQPASMDLLVRTLKGSIQLRGLVDSLSIAEVKSMLHEQYKEGPQGVPEPQRQRLVRSGGEDATRAPPLLLLSPPLLLSPLLLLPPAAASLPGSSTRAPDHPPLHAPPVRSPLRCTRGASSGTARRRWPTRAWPAATSSCCCSRPSCRPRPSPSRRR